MSAVLFDRDTIRRIEDPFVKTSVIGAFAHYGQDYSTGIPHLRHVEAVSEGAGAVAEELVRDYGVAPVLVNDSRCLGMVHDGPEDNKLVTFEFLLDVEVPYRVVCGAYGITKKAGEDRERYRDRLCRPFRQILFDSYMLDRRLADWLGGMSRTEQYETARLIAASVVANKAPDAKFNSDRGKILALWGRDVIRAAYRSAGVTGEELSAWERRQLVKEKAAVYDYEREDQRRKHLFDCQKLDQYARKMFPGFTGYSDIIEENRLAVRGSFTYEALVRDAPQPSAICLGALRGASSSVGIEFDLANPN